MVPEQQQRILGYFIEEAKDHLNTIEQGLLNLQATIGNPEMANEVFRAAHSVKGGAAMLGIESMQRTAHRLEDYFKLLKEAPIQVDRPLESMFLQVFDALQELLEQLQGPFGLTEEKERSIMTGVEPVFQQLQEHLDQLVAVADSTTPPAKVAAVATAAPTPYPVEESALKLVFSSDVSAALREMLARFKQADTDESRQALEQCCQLLEGFGEQFNLPAWLNLAKHARWAICDRNTDYRTLAPVLIKEIKKAQDLVLAGREPEILVSDTLQALASEGSAIDTTNDFDTLFADSELESVATPVELEDLSVLEENTSLEDISIADGMATTTSDNDAISLDDLLNEAAAPSGPEVGAAELTSLADLFETSSDDLDSGWQEEDEPLTSNTEASQTLDIDNIAPDFEDLLNDDSPVTTSDDFASGDELADLFGGADVAAMDAADLFGDTDITATTSDVDLFGDTDIADTADGLDNLGNELDSLSRETTSLEPPNDENLVSIDDLFGGTPPIEDETIASNTASGDDELLSEFDSVPDDDLLSNLEEPPAELNFDLSGNTAAPLDELDLLVTPSHDDENTAAGSDSELLDLDLGFVGNSSSSDSSTDLELALNDDPFSGATEDLELALNDDLFSGAAELATEPSESSSNNELFSTDLPNAVTAPPNTSSDDFFSDAVDATDRRPTSDFDDFFQVDSTAPSPSADSSVDEDLWNIADDNVTESSPIDSPANDLDDLSEDIWADASLDISDLGGGVPETASISPVAIEEPEDLALDDLWASTESTEEDPVEETLAADTSANVDSELDGLFGSETDEFLDLSTAENQFEIGDPEDTQPGSLTDISAEETDNNLDDLFAAATTDTSDITGLDELDLTSESVNESASSDGIDADFLNEPPSSDIDFDLLDLEDGGIVTGFVNDMPEAPGEPPSLDLLADIPEISSTSDLPDLELETELTEDSDKSGATNIESTDTNDEFGDLEALLDSTSSSRLTSPSPESTSSTSDEDEFGDLEALLQDADQALASTSASSVTSSYRPSANRLPAGRRMVTDQTMRVSVGHLDNLSNLVGELVVNRNTLEQDQERLRQFLENLLFQVQQLNDVGQRMRDLYERSLLESSLISSRQSYQMSTTTSMPIARSDDHATGESFDALEMDRFTGFHTLSQEMIELIVRVRESASDIAYTVESSDQVTRQFRQVTNQLQEGLNKARMVPFAQTAARLPRAVRDISLKCGKEARLVVEGRDILIDKMILEQLYDPMTHLVNNAITHGIEPPENRQAAGKSPEGLITVRAFYQGNQTVISVGDDGAGIDPEVVKRKALQKGLISTSDIQTMTVLDVYDLLFHPGFSTRDQADDFAGRGFGMDVVRTSLADIRGNITIDSEPGRGTTFTIRLPLTLSISKALSCVSNQARIAFPMDGVEDMFDVARERIQKNDQDQDCILWRDNLLPFQNLSDLLSFNRTLGRGRVYGGNQDENIVSIVVLRSTNSFIALQVDQVMGEQEIVIKQLEGPVPKPTGIAGATVLGDGRVMPIADVLELIDLAMGRVRREPNAAVWAQTEDALPEEATTSLKSEPTVLIVDDSITVRELLSMSFNKVGYRVEQARDGQEAWEKLRSGLPCDLVFCDIEMPRMDGLELLSRLQKDGGLSNIPIAMLTSRGADRHRQMAVDLGASGYFTKPYLEEALLDAANKMLHGERLV
ncbi:MAG: response regulator [Cyanobacteria bacterium P01_D01_bin.56]